MSEDPTAFEFHWKQIQFVFGLPDPSSFPRLCAELEPSSAAAMTRYCDAARELATSSLFSSAVGYEVSGGLGDDGNQHVWNVTSSFPKGEIIRGFAALFRQFYAADEPASFKKIQAYLRIGADAEPDDFHSQRIDMLASWRRAHGQLRAYSMKSLLWRTLSKAGQWPPEGTNDGPSPEWLISRFFYGENLHWGDHAQELEALKADPFLGTWHEFEWLSAATSLAHIYMGFSLIVEAAIR